MDGNIDSCGIIPIRHFEQFFFRDHDTMLPISKESLEDACQNIENFGERNDVQPILIYLHHQKSLHTPMFCGHILKHGHIVDYITDKYIMWGYDVTIPSDLEIIEKRIKKLNSSISIPNTPNDYPMLIAVRLSTLEEQFFRDQPKYWCEIIARNYTLQRTKEICSFDGLAKELQLFRADFDRASKRQTSNQFNQFESSPLTDEDQLRKLSHLSLDEILSSFSEAILPWLRIKRVPLNLALPSTINVNAVSNYFDPDQVKSLHICNASLFLDEHLQKYSNFEKLNSLTIEIFQTSIESNFFKSFRFLRNLTIKFKTEISIQNILNYLHIIPEQIEEIVITIEQEFDFYGSAFMWMNLTKPIAKRLTLDLGIFPIPVVSNNEALSENEFLKIVIKKISSLTFLEEFHLVMNKDHIERFIFCVDLWESLKTTCKNLKSITIGLHGDITESELSNLNEVVGQVYKDFQDVHFRIV